MADNDSLNPLLDDHDRKQPEEQESSSGGSYKPPPIHTEPSSSSNPLSSFSNPLPSPSSNPFPLHPSSSLLSPPSSSSSKSDIPLPPLVSRSIPPSPPVFTLPSIPLPPSNQLPWPVSSPSSNPNQSLRRTTSEASLALRHRLYAAGQNRWFHTVEDARKYALASIKSKSSADDKILAAASIDPVMQRFAVDEEANTVDAIEEANRVAANAAAATTATAATAATAAAATTTTVATAAAATTATAATAAAATTATAAAATVATTTAATTTAATTETAAAATTETAAAAIAAAVAARQATIEQRKSLYDQEIVPLEPGHIFKIDGYSALDPLRDLVKEKEELNNHVLGIFNYGRGLKYEICMILAGTVTLGLLSAIMKALLADKVTTLEKWSVLGVFSVAFLLSVSATIYELYRVYEPLVDAHASRATLIRRMNLVRDSLAAPESEVIGERLGEEHPLNKLLKEFCDKITGPLPIGWQKCSCFIQVGSLILIIMVAFVFMALTPPPSKHDGCNCGTGS